MLAYQCFFSILNVNSLIGEKKQCLSVVYSIVIAHEFLDKRVFNNKGFGMASLLRPTYGQINVAAIIDNFYPNSL